jgi:repressor LexA
MEDLSPRQRDVLDYIQSSIAQRNIPPTYREIGDALGISSTNGVADHVKALIRKG